MKFKSYSRVFIGKTNEIHILIDKKSNWEFPEFQISRDTSWAKIEPGPLYRAAGIAGIKP